MEIFKVYVCDVFFVWNVDLGVFVVGFVGFIGVDIWNIVNEVVLWVVWKNKMKVEMSDFEYVCDKVLMGVKWEEVLIEKDKEKMVYYEVGYIFVVWYFKGVYLVYKVIIILCG